MTQDARQIYQQHLDISARAFMADDFEAAMTHMATPAYLGMLDSEYQIDTDGEMLECLREARESLRRMGAQAFLRVCRDARFDAGSPDRIVGAHETLILRGGARIIPPYRCVMTLDLVDGSWRVRGASANVANRDYTVFGHHFVTSRHPAGPDGDAHP